MKKFINKIKNNKVLSILSVLIIGLFFILVTRITYAYLAPVINDAQTNVVGSTDTVDDFKFELGNPLKINATPTTLKENGTNYTTSTTAKALLKANSTKKTATFNYYVYFQIKSNTFIYSDGSTPEIILTVTSPNGDEITSIDGLTYGTFNGVSGFDITTKKGLFNIANNHEITSNSSTTYTTQSWTIKITYLNLSIDQSANFGNSMGVNVYITKNEKKLTVADICSSEQTLSSCIIAMDGKDDTLYHHTSTLTNGAGDNSYRYAGASDSVNNYICLGSDEATCPDANLFRIIGVFGDKTKVIRAKSVGNQKWYTNGSNTWSTSSLNTYLNGTYLTSLGTLTDKIATTTWKVGGGLWANIAESVPKTAYQYEVGSSASSTTYDAKIGLMYVTDYYYSASPSAWTLVGYNSSDATKDYRAAKIINWLYLGSEEWTISRMDATATDAFRVASAGGVSLSGDVPDSCGVRPSFNLESSVKYVSGSGSMSDPVRVTD